MQSKTKRLTESAMLLAVAILLELLSKTFIPEQPFGGQLTIVSMLPIVLISYRHGVKWGFAAPLPMPSSKWSWVQKPYPPHFCPGTLATTL